MNIRLEHANICVTDIEAMMKFLQTISPDFKIRGGGGTGSDRWVHFGNNETYIALQQASEKLKTNFTPYSGTPGVNHLAFEVDDVEALQNKLEKAGYKNSTVPNNHPFRKRIYFYDPEGNDWEFVEYLTEIQSERHDYDTPDK